MVPNTLVKRNKEGWECNLGAEYVLSMCMALGLRTSTVKNRGKKNGEKTSWAAACSWFLWEAWVVRESCKHLGIYSCFTNKIIWFESNMEIESNIVEISKWLAAKYLMLSIPFEDKQIKFERAKPGTVCKPNSSLRKHYHGKVILRNLFCSFWMQK